MSRKVLADVRGYARAGRIRYTWHARNESMPKRRVTYGDVENALINATSCLPDEDETWKVIGPDVDGDDLKLIVVVEEGVLVVTVW